MDGLIIIDKPSGPTSHDIVLRVRKALRLRRVGHGGTLDPAATGVLLVTIGRATRFFPYLSGHEKSYEGLVRLGFATDTYDGSGRPVSAECRDLPPAEAVAQAMRRMQGEVLQTPPAYSAKKVGGTPGYKLARAEKDFALKPVPVYVRAFDMLEYRPPLIVFRAVCSAGTFVRSLANDLGRTLGCGAHLHSLRRTAVGPFTLKDAHSPERVEEAAAAGKLSSIVLPLENLLSDVPALYIEPEAVRRVRNGASLSTDHLAARFPGVGPTPPGAPVYRLFDKGGRLVALCRLSPEGDALLPFLVIG